MAELKKAVGYVRVSTQGQSTEGKFGIDAQKSAITDYAVKNGYRIISWITDIGSGATDKREGLQALMFNTHISCPPYEAVICYKNDRIARDTKLYFTTLYFLERRGVKLISTQEEFVDEALANVYRSLLQFVAEQERRNIMNRTMSGKRIKAESGGYAGGRVAFGYKSDHGYLEIEPKEAETVRKIFELHEAGWSLRNIAEAIPAAKNGKRLNYTSIKRILDREMLYRGFYKYGDCDWVKGQQEAILVDKK